jgi:hypothetical protein
MLLLWAAATPFSPIAWLTGGFEGAYLADRFLAGILLFGAMYFQYQIACQTHPVAIVLPDMPGSGERISGGRINANVGRGGDVLFIYHPAEYWKYAGAEAVALIIAEYARMESLRMAIVCGVVAALWSVGWTVTPERVKQQGWEYAKRMWFWIALDEVMNATHRRRYRR